MFNFYKAHKEKIRRMNIIRNQIFDNLQMSLSKMLPFGTNKIGVSHATVMITPYYKCRDCKSKLEIIALEDGSKKYRCPKCKWENHFDVMGKLIII